ncbi:MAG: hypothetical protein IIA45_00155 [Bacteroidetes bacterium]|nr:hypothetical protein [Bacteroidota bacterium]
MSNTWPDNKSFAFTIVDDTDNSTVENIAPVYALLEECGIKITKTVWVYPPRDDFSGGSLQDENYRKFVTELKESGFEIALHGVGSGSFNTEEILAGVELYKEHIREYPVININHSQNPDSIYWGYKRFTAPLSWLMGLIPGRRAFSGEDPVSPHFWGDWYKKNIRFTRNLVFNGINTLAADPKMPYPVRKKDQYSNAWFSSSDAHTLKEFNRLVNPKNIQRLKRQNGCCIVYTHFAEGFVNENGQLDPEFENNIRSLSQQGGWFVPAGQILSYLASINGNGHYASYSYLVRLEMKWLLHRIVKKIKYGK